jgi:hypothetical protein
MLLRNKAKAKEAGMGRPRALTHALELFIWHNRKAHLGQLVPLILQRKVYKGIKSIKERPVCSNLMHMQRRSVSAAGSYQT